MHIENTSYYGLPAQSIASQRLRLVYLTGEGPRLVGLYLCGDERNFLAELPELGIEAPHGRYNLRGGHRLWVAPEDMEHTYLPDDLPPQIEVLSDGVRLTGLPHPLAGLQKRIEFRLDRERPVVTARHWIENRSAAAVELAPWAITQLPTGGVAYLPQHTHALDVDGLLPNRTLALWPYTSLADPRLALSGRVWQVRAAGGEHVKIGYLNLVGWIAYVRDGRVFVKRQDAEAPGPNLALPDMGVNAEVYTDQHMIELETLGPLVTLLPGQSVQHDEIWEVYPALDAPGLDPKIAFSLQTMATS